MRPLPAQRTGVFRYGPTPRVATVTDWVAIAISMEPGEKKPLLFDSFGRIPGATFMPHLVHAETTDPDRNQEWESTCTRCG